MYSHSGPDEWSVTCDMVVTSTDTDLVNVLDDTMTLTTTDDSKAGTHSVKLTATSPFSNTLEFWIDILICIYPTYTESAWTAAAISYDLLNHFSETIALPDSHVVTSSCYEYSVNWSVHKVSDDTDIGSDNFYIDPAN